MPALTDRLRAEKAADIVRHAGGKVVGKTRLQKMAYLLEITGLGAGFPFEYRHYGPYSEELADGIAGAYFWDLMSEEEHTANWGGAYSVFRASSTAGSARVNPARREILTLASKANPISLELAATAAFLAKENSRDPWAETSRRKPEKAEKYLDDAKILYSKLREIKTPKKMPAI
jgi:uncharacterized protein YwgA